MSGLRSPTTKQVEARTLDKLKIVAAILVLFITLIAFPFLIIIGAPLDIGLKLAGRRGIWRKSYTEYIFDKTSFEKV